jgi:hypothetical protein
LRPSIEEYIGNYDWKNKRTLELGAANGFVTSELEKRGAEVIAVDLSAKHDWDLVPYHDAESQGIREPQRVHINQLNNAWWLTHDRLNLKARAVYSTAYDVPSEIGPVDVAFFGSILLHLRDPFLAVQRAATFAKEAIIVTDLMPEPIQLHTNIVERFFDRIRGRSNTRFQPQITFLPRSEKRKPIDTWWYLSPELISEFLKILGYVKTQVIRHSQWCELESKNLDLFTVVGRRD